MFKKFATLTLVGLLIQAAICVEPVWASSTAEKEARLAANMKARVVKLGVSKDASIMVALRDKTKLSGFISEIGDSSFAVTDPTTGVVTAVGYNTATQIGRRRRAGGWKYGLLIAAVGLTIAIIAAR